MCLPLIAITSKTTSLVCFNHTNSHNVNTRRGDWHFRKVHSMRLGRLAGSASRFLSSFFADVQHRRGALEETTTITSHIHPWRGTFRSPHLLFMSGWGGSTEAMCVACASVNSSANYWYPGVFFLFDTSSTST